jgi:type II secretory pathway predicted ATPase ExeA
MYETRFGLRRRPFRATPDSETYYPATAHEAALGRLLQAVLDDEGIAVLTGDPGTGKTLLCHRLLERLGTDVASLLLTHSHFSGRAGLLQAVLFDLSLPYEGRSEQELRLALTDHLLKTYSEGRRTVLVVDEAHHLTPDLLEELRLLGNLESRRGKALQVVLAAQPRLLEHLRRPRLASFSQRLAVRVHLDSLGVQEAADYLVHHLRAAGGQPAAIITDEALELLARATHGVPRLLNQAAHQALLLAHAADTASVDTEAALEALVALGLDPQAASAESHDLAAEADRPLHAADLEAPEEGSTAGLLLPLEELLHGDEASVNDPPEEPVEPPHLFATPRRPA